MKEMKLILASQSPRRKQLLEQIGLIPICRPVDIDESIMANEAPHKYCQRLAMEKAQAGWDESDKSLPVLGSDTIVVLNGKTLGKPKNHEDAYEMLKSLSGCTHQVITAVALICDNKNHLVKSVSYVEFDNLTEDEIKSYVATNEPMDKAGSYAIQGIAAKWIKQISGSYSGIMGLPLYETARLLRDL